MKCVSRHSPLVNLRPAALLAAACLWLCAPAQSSAQIQVSLPTLTLDAGQWVVLPITTTDLSANPPASSYQFTASYDPAILKITEALTSGTLSDGMSIVCNTSTPGQVTVVAAGAEPLSGGGTLLELRARVLGTGTSPLRWAGFMFNEGTPGVLTTDGSVTLSQAAATYLIVGLPQITAQVGDTLDVPISVGEATGKEVFSYQFTLAFDPTIVRIIAAVGGAGTISEGMSLQANSSAPGRFSVAAAAGVPLQGAGTLLTLRVRTVGVGASALQWSSFVFNEGMPIAQTSDGAALVGGTSSVQVSLPQVSADVGDIVEVPITVADLEGKGVMSYRLDLSFDPGVLSCVGLVADPSTLSAGMTVASNSLFSGRVTVAAAGSSAISGAGTGALLKLKLKCLRAGFSGLHWEGFTFNEGNPLAALTDGSVAVQERPEERVSFALPELAVHVGDTASVSLTMTRPTRTGVNSYRLVLTFDPLIARLLDVTADETTLSDGMALQVNRSESGRVTVVAAAASPVVEGGTLLKLRILAVKAGVSPVRLQSAELNEGWPLAGSSEGTITVGARPPATVSLGEFSTELGNRLDVPVIVGDLTGVGVAACEFSLAYDPETLRPTGVRAGAMGGASAMTLQFNAERPGELVVTAAGGTPLDGAGELAVLEMEAVGVGVSPLHWRSFVFNEGDPLASLGDGGVTVSGVQVAPAAPLPFSPGDGSTDVQLVVPLRWNPSAGAATYRVQVSVDTTFATVLVDDAGISGLSREVRLPAKGSRYYWRLRAANDAGESGWSRAGALTTGASANSPPVARVLFPNPTPAGQNATAATNEDTDLMLALGGTDADGDRIAVSISTLPAKGTLYESLDGLTRGAAITSLPAEFAEIGKRVVFAAARDEYGNGYARLGFTVSDGQVTSAEVFATVNVLPVNDPPQATADQATTRENVSALVHVLDNDHEPDGDPLKVTAVGPARNGFVAVGRDSATVVYTPGQGFVGTGSFTYTVGDGKGLSSSADVTVMVTAVDEAPYAVSAFDSDAEGWTAVGDVLLPVRMATGGNPGGCLSAGDSEANQTWYWRPPARFLGNVAASYGSSLRFDLKQSSTAGQFIADDVVLVGGGITLTLRTNNSPGLSWTTYGVSLDENAGWLNSSGSPVSGIDMRAVLLSLTDLRIRGEYRNGPDTGGLDNVVLNARMDNRPPVAESDVATVEAGEAVRVMVLANDTDPDLDRLTVLQVSGGTHGVAAVDPGDTTVTFVPEAGFVGIGSFSYLVSDGREGSDGATVQITVIHVPLAPTGVGATPGNAQILLEWQASSEADISYYVVYRGVSAGEADSVAAVQSPGRTYADAGLENGTTYYYRLAAVNTTGGKSPLSPQLHATPQGPPRAPDLPAASSGNSQATLVWSPVPLALSYHLYGGTEPVVTKAGSLVQHTSVSTPHVVIDLVNGTTYYFAIAAVGIGGESELSPIVGVTPQVLQAPSAAEATPGDRSITVRWNPVEDASSYNLYAGTEAGVSKTTSTLAIPGVTSPFTLNSLQNGTTYFLVVTASGLSGESEPSQEVEATPQNPIQIALDTVAGRVGDDVLVQVTIGEVDTDEPDEVVGRGIAVVKASCSYDPARLRFGELNLGTDGLLSSAGDTIVLKPESGHLEVTARLVDPLPHRGTLFLLRFWVVSGNPGDLIPVSLESSELSARVVSAGQTRLVSLPSFTASGGVSVLSPRAALPGDVNHSGGASALDAILILRFMVGLEQPNVSATGAGVRDFSLDVADVNRDGKISPVDAATILRYEARLISTLPWTAAKPLGAGSRLLSLGEPRPCSATDEIIPVSLADWTGVVAGWFVFAYDPSELEMVEVTVPEGEDNRLEGGGDWSVAGDARAGRLYVAMARGESGAGDGDLLSIRVRRIGASEVGAHSPPVLRVAEALLNDERSGVSQYAPGATRMRLGQNSPNPFNAETVVHFELAESGPATLSVLDANGRVVTTLLTGRYPPGTRWLRWGGTDDHGRPVGSGVYVLRLEAGGTVLTRKMVMIK